MNKRDIQIKIKRIDENFKNKDKQFSVCLRVVFKFKLLSLSISSKNDIANDSFCVISAGSLTTKISSEELTFFQGLNNGILNSLTFFLQSHCLEHLLLFSNNQ